MKLFIRDFSTVTYSEVPDLLDATISCEPTVRDGDDRSRTYAFTSTPTEMNVVVRIDDQAKRVLKKIFERFRSTELMLNPKCLKYLRRYSRRSKS